MSLIENLLVNIYFYLITALFLIFIGALAASIHENRRVFTFIQQKTYFQLLGVVILAAMLRYFFTLFFPVVFNDEFYYLATAENLAKFHKAVPLIFRSFPPQPFGEAKFLPPYPQGWPMILSYVFMLTKRYTFDLAANFSLIISSLVPIPVFFAGYFMFEGLGKRDERTLSGEMCGIFAALAWAVLPVLIKMTGCASTEVASTFFIAVYIAALFMYYRYPSFKTFLLLAAALGLAVNFRPENILYVFLMIPVFINGRLKILKDSKVVSFLVMIFYALIPVLIMYSGRLDPVRTHNFVATPRAAYSSVLDNFLGNLTNNLLFLVGYKGIHPLILTLLFVGGLIFLIGMKQNRFRGLLFLGWTVFFYLVLAPFPFGDFASVNSYDSYRFSLHIYFPIIFAGAYCCFALWNLFRKWHLETPAFIILSLIISVSLINHRAFLKKTHPDGYYFSAMKKIVNVVPEESILVAEKPDRGLAVHYASGLPVYLLSRKKDVDSFEPGDREVFMFSVYPPTELILRNFDIDVYSRHQQDRNEYSIFRLEKFKE